MRGKRQDRRSDIIEYFGGSEYVSAYQLQHSCNLPYMTELNIIKRYLKNGWIVWHGYFKLPEQRNKVKIYQIIDKDKIMKSIEDKVWDSWVELKQQKVLSGQLTNTNLPSTNTNLPSTNTNTNTNSYSVPSASLVPIKNNKAVPSGEFGPVILEKLPEDSGAVLGGETELRDTIELKRRQREASEELAPINWKGLNGRTLSPEEFEKVFQLAKTFRK